MDVRTIALSGLLAITPRIAESLLPRDEAHVLNDHWAPVVHHVTYESVGDEPPREPARTIDFGPTVQHASGTARPGGLTW